MSQKVEPEGVDATETVGDRELYRYPHDFETWPRAAQAEYVAANYTRAGLVSALLELCERDTGERAISGNTVLSKADLAAVVLALDGPDFATDGYPDGFDAMDCCERVQAVAERHRRVGLLRAVLHRVTDGDVTQDLGTDTKLRKEVLARMYLSLQEIDHEG